MSSLLDDLEDLGSDASGDIVVRPVGSRQTYFSGGNASSKIAVDVGDFDGDAGDADADSDDADDNAGGGVGAVAGGAGRDAGTELPRDAALDAELFALKTGLGFSAVARLRKTRRFSEHLSRVEGALASGGVPEVVGPLEEWPEYATVVTSSTLLSSVDDEMHAVWRFAAAAFAVRFPELETVVPAMADFMRVIEAIGNEMDLTKVDLSFLSSSAVMVVTVTGSTTSGRAFTASELGVVSEAIAEWKALSSARVSLLEFIESRMAALAPNVTELLSSRVAAMLIACAGGLIALARAPSCNVQVFGAKRRAGAGTIVRGAGGAAASVPHAGVIYDAPILAVAPTDSRMQALRALAGKVVLAARMDAFRTAGGGEAGRGLRADLEAKFTKWGEPPPARAAKPLAAPDEKKSKRRGGRAARARKEKFGVTDVRREANRVAVNINETADYADSAMGMDLGGLGAGASATGRLRVAERSGQLKKILGGGAKRRRVGGMGGGAAGGTLSSFAMTPVQGIELANPAKAAAEPASGASAYFKNTGTFSFIRQ